MNQKVGLHVYFEQKKLLQHFFFCFFLCLHFIHFSTFSQDSIPVKKDITEEKALQFQEFFFKALSEKSIENYQKAIENLESCNQILENQSAVFFEFSKNYLALQNTALAKEYLEKALQNDSENFWMLKHLVAIFEKESNFLEAIKTQQKIAKTHLNEREDLLRLYLLNNQLKEALELLLILEKENGVKPAYAFLKSMPNNTKVPDATQTKSTDLSALIHQYNSNKSYAILESILQKSEKKIDTLLLFSKEGITLFPEQPFVYLQHGKALNQQNEFAKAINSLKNGLDFVIEPTMEKEFYIEIAKAYKALGNSIEEKKYLQKATQLKR